MGSSKRKRQKKNCKKSEKKFKIFFFTNHFFFKIFIKYQLIYRAIATTFLSIFFYGFLAELLAFEVFCFSAIFVVFHFFLVPPRGPPFTPLPQCTPKIKNI